MPATIDLNLMVIARQAGMDQSDLPGLYTAEPPRNAARGREGDRLVLYLALGGSLPEPTERPGQTLASLASVYYKSPGSVTSAMRQVMDSLNQTMYSRNLSSSRAAQQTGKLCLLALRGDQVYLAQSGPITAFLITTAAVQELYDPDLPTLGTTEETPHRYFQATLSPNDTLLISALPQENWSAENLKGIYGQGPEGQRRRLLSQGTQDVSAILVQARPGKGSIHHLRSVPGQADQQAEGQAITEAAPVPTGGLDWSAPPPAENGEFSPWTALPQEQVAVAETGVESQTIPSVGDTPLTGAVSEPFPVEKTSQRSLSGCLIAPFLWLGKLFSGIVSGIARLLQLLLSRLLPEETLASISNGTMALIAIIVPVAIVVAAAIIYFQRGQAVESQVVLEQALEAAQQAAAQTDPLAQRQGWVETLNHLNSITAYPNQPQAQELRSMAQTNLDRLDQIRRIDYRQAIVGGLPAGIQVSRMVVSGNTLYLLDSSSGGILRASPTAQGFVLDDTFQCNFNQPSQAGPFIDILPNPIAKDPPADLMAVDAAGNLLFCRAEPPHESGSLQPPATRPFTQISGFTQDYSDLYVLDPPSNAVWVYGKTLPGQEPKLYFDEAPPNIQNAIDLTTATDELYLLHSDGHLTSCQTSRLEASPTRCTDPAPYIDSRPGRDNLPLIPTSPYNQVEYAPPPDPALYLLEPASQAVDLYSLQHLTFQRRFLPVNPLAGGQASAFAIDPIERTLFLAVGNNLYYGRLP